MFKNKYIKIRGIVMICSGFPSMQNHVLINEKNLPTLHIFCNNGTVNNKAKEAEFWKERDWKGQGKDIHVG